MKVKYILIFFTLLCRVDLSAQQADQGLTSNAKINWKIEDPFSQKVFIENRGQFDGNDEIEGSKILYGTDNACTFIYFTPKGLTYKLVDTRYVKKDEDIDESDFLAAMGIFDEQDKGEEFYTKINKSLVHMQWLNANPNPEVIALDKVQDYYNYIIDAHPAYGISFIPVI